MRTRMNSRLVAIVTLAALVSACSSGNDDAGPSGPSSGDLVAAFDGGGVVTVNPVSSAEATALAVDASFLYVAGQEGSTWRIEKRDIATGAPVAGFDTDGVASSAPSPGLGAVEGIAIDATHIYVVGVDYGAGGTFPEQWRIEKRDIVTGALDPSFDGEGVVTSDPTGSDDEPRDIAIDSTYMYVVGVDFGGGDFRWRIEKRSLATGALDTGFDGDGVVISDPPTSGEVPYAIAIDGTSMYVVGFDAGGAGASARWRIEKRSLATGALDGVFGGGSGVVTSDFAGVGGEEARDIAIDATSMYVVGYDDAGAGGRWRIEKRSLTTGALVIAFDGDGVVLSDPSAGYDLAQAVAISGTSLYVVGDDEGGIGDSYQWRIEKRDVTTGALVTTFGTGGVVTSEPGADWEEPAAVAVDGSYLYVTGFDVNGTNGNPREWRIEKRLK